MSWGGRGGYHGKRMQEVTKNCGRCGSEFVTIKPATRFCDDECRELDQKEQQRARERLYRYRKRYSTG